MYGCFVHFCFGVVQRDRPGTCSCDVMDATMSTALLLMTIIVKPAMLLMTIIVKPAMLLMTTIVKPAILLVAM